MQDAINFIKFKYSSLFSYIYIYKHEALILNFFNEVVLI